MSDDVTVRNAAAADAAAIAALATELGYPADADAIGRRLGASLSSGDQLVAVAKRGGAVVGWIQVQTAVTLEGGFRADIVGLIVAGASRRRGVGRRLVERAEAWARERGAPALVVRSNVAREESHRFYPALGYVAVKTQTVYRKTLPRPAAGPASEAGG